MREIDPTTNANRVVPGRFGAVFVACCATRFRAFQICRSGSSAHALAVARILLTGVVAVIVGPPSQASGGLWVGIVPSLVPFAQGAGRYTHRADCSEIRLPNQEAPIFVQLLLHLTITTMPPEVGITTRVSHPSLRIFKRCWKS